MPSFLLEAVGEERKLQRRFYTRPTRYRLQTASHLTRVPIPNLCQIKEAFIPILQGAMKNDETGVLQCINCFPRVFFFFLMRLRVFVSRA